MQIRVLGLHGMGDNAEIFRAQTAAIRDLLPSSYSFTFIDGEDLCHPSRDVADAYSDPYRCWYTSPNTQKVARAHRVVQKAIAREGGFDVVMGFSQGASLAASLILHHQIEHRNAPPLFRAAIFICAPLPFSTHLTHGIDTRRYFGITTGPRLEDRPTTLPEYLIPSDAAYLQPDDEVDESDGTTGDDSDTLSLSMGREVAQARRAGSNKLRGPFYQMFHPAVDHVRIAIPTAHVYGRQDSWRSHSVDLVKLCRPEMAYVYEHDAGHKIPRDESEEICDAIEMAVARAMLT